MFVKFAGNKISRLRRMHLNILTLTEYFSDSVESNVNLLRFYVKYPYFCPF